jgi:hypothetical protein
VIHDFDAIGDRYEFLATSIPTDGSQGRATTISARQTRFNLDIFQDNQAIRFFAEGDFFGEGGDFRLRHGFVEYRGLILGQNWSTFQDESIIPSTLDYEGPVGLIFGRQPQLRWTLAASDQCELAIAIEDASQSDSNVSLPFSGRDDHRLPDLVGRVRQEFEFGHVQVASVLRDVAFESELTDDQRTTGWGLSISGALNAGTCDGLMAQVALGEGFARYIEDLDGTGSDAGLNVSGDLVALPTVGLFAGWNHRWARFLQSTFAYGFARVRNSDGQSPNAFHRSEYVSGNMVWSPLTDLDMGLEVLWGSRQDKDRSRGEAVRMQFSTTFRF